MRQPHDGAASHEFHKTPAIFERAVDGKFLRKLQRELKEGRGWSARMTAEHLGITRATLKGMQTGKKSIGELVAVRARNLHREFVRERHEQGDAEKFLLVLVSKRPLDGRMRQLEILAKPRRCDGCGRWFVPRQARQKRHNDRRCHARAARRRRKRAEQ